MLSAENEGVLAIPRSNDMTSCIVEKAKTNDHRSTNDESQHVIKSDIRRHGHVSGGENEWIVWPPKPASIDGALPVGIIR
jgi:hypothetical protein